MGYRAWIGEPASACGPLVPPDAVVIVPCVYIWTWSCNPILKARSEKELSAGPKSLFMESKLLAMRNPMKGLRTLLLL